MRWGRGWIFFSQTISFLVLRDFLIENLFKKLKEKHLICKTFVVCISPEEGCH